MEMDLSRMMMAVTTMNVKVSLEGRVLSSVASSGVPRWRRVALCGVGATGLASDHLLQAW